MNINIEGGVIELTLAVKGYDPVVTLAGAGFEPITGMVCNAEHAILISQQAAEPPSPWGYLHIDVICVGPYQSHYLASGPGRLAVKVTVTGRPKRDCSLERPEKILFQRAVKLTMGKAEWLVAAFREAKNQEDDTLPF